MTGKVAAGFTEIATRDIPESATRARHFRHDRTGADAVFLLNADAARTFAIAFRTHPADSTGIAHVLEHCVLSGSRAYPTAKPFLDLLKGSLQSHLNASTFADFTIYLAASPHPLDFANLVDVYLDAVFFPLLCAESFQREGWHMSAEGTPQGVVLNEMKGICASPDHMLAEHARRSLFRAGPFSHAHGGDPDRIPDLTHDGMKRFHQRFYHPSNALAAYSGVDDIHGELRRLDRVFNQFERREPHRTSPGPVVTAPQTQSFNHTGTGPPRLALNWAFPVPASRLTELAYDVLSEALVGSSFAPLRRALIDAGQCADVVEGRFHDDTSPPRLSIQLAGVNADRTMDVQRTLRRTLERLIRDGFASQTLAGALNAVEFRHRDRSSWKRPHAVGLLLEVAKAWRLGRDPVHALEFAPELAGLRRKPPGFFEDMLKVHLLENPRFTQVILIPDSVRKNRTGSTSPRRPRPAPPEHMVTRHKPKPSGGMPRLTLQDLSPDPAGKPISVDQAGGVPVLFHRRQTDGLVHVDLALDLQGLPQLSCAALFARVLLQSGTARRGGRDMSNRIWAETGGLSCEVLSAAMADRTGVATRLMLRGRAVADRAPPLFDILGEVLSEAVIPEPPRLTEIVTSEITRVSAQILPRAHDVIDRRLRRHVNAAEPTAGLSYLRFLHDFQALIRRNPDRARQQLLDIQTTLTCRKRLAINIVCDGTSMADLPGLAQRLVGLLPVGGRTEANDAPPVPQPSEAFIVPGEANFVGVAFDTQISCDAPSASLAVALRYLETGWLWTSVREEGGAYGVQCRGDPSSGVSTFISYRDPHILRTLDVFAAAGQHPGRGVSREDLTRSITAMIGALDRPLSPPDCGLNALTDWLTGRTAESRRAFRAGVLATKQADLKGLGDVLSGADVKNVVFGGETALDHALRQRPGLFTIKNVPGP